MSFLGSAWGTPTFFDTTVFSSSQEITKMGRFGLKIIKIRVWPKSQKFQNGFVDQPSPVFVTVDPFVQYLAPLGAKYIEKMPKK